MRRNSLGLIGLLSLGLLGLAGHDAGVQAEVTVSISCSSLGIESELCRSGAEAWAGQTGNRVKLVSTPPDANERLGLYQTLLAAQSQDVDIFQIDIIWPGALASHFLDLNSALPESDRKDHLEILIDNNTVDGKLIAIPWFVDAGLLYYRKDLLEKHGRQVPETWSELVETATAIQEAEGGGLQGYVWQGRAYEGLVCNALEWIASHGGGTILDQEGKVTIDNPAAAASIQLAQSWIGTISPKGVLGYSEEEARGAFQSGKAVFMRNWPYAWALVNAPDSPVKDMVGVAALPKGDGESARHVATLGGQQLAVSRYSAHPEEAIDLVLYLTGLEEQKRRAIRGSFNPTRRSLYNDPEVLMANPFFKDFQQVLDGAVARPSTVAGERYSQLSSAFVGTVHEALSSGGDTAPNLTQLARRIDRLSRGGNW